MPISYRAAQTLIKRGDEPVLRVALEAGLDPNLANQHGWSLLMLAALEGAVPIGTLLLNQGAAVDPRNRHEETALSLAAQKGHVPFMKLLLDHGASVHCRPHGVALLDWLTTSSGFPEAKLAEIRTVLGNHG